jgi:2-dehydro-3-deoxygalactonokinase
MSARYSIAGDWGTSRLRLFKIVDEQVLDRIDGPGIAALAGIAPAQVLLDAIAPWRADGDPARILLCGMAGARTGLAEAPYVDCPADVDDWVGRACQLELDAIPVAIAAGMACTRADGAPDVMRGEETQVFGALRLHPALVNGRQLLALPGTHCKWAWLEAGRVTQFQTVPAGELFALLRDHSSLARVGSDPGGEAEGFADGLSAAAATRGALLGRLFRARAAQLRSGKSHGWALGYLSGLVIGSEVAEVIAASPLAADVTLIGDRSLCSRYARALAGHDVATTLLDGDDCALAGLRLFQETVPWT